MTHGLRKLETMLKSNERKLDGRGRVMKLLKRRALDWADDAGGLEHLSNREQTLLWHTAATSLMVESILHWALAQPSLLDANHEMLPPLRKSLIAYLNAERRGLEALGLKPERTKDLPTLEQYLARRPNGSASHHDANGAHDDDHGTGQATASTAAPAAPTEPA